MDHRLHDDSLLTDPGAVESATTAAPKALPSPPKKHSAPHAQVRSSSTTIDDAVAAAYMASSTQLSRCVSAPVVGMAMDHPPGLARREQTIANQVVVKAGAAPSLAYDDLLLAENLHEHGTLMVRTQSGLSQKDFDAMMTKPEVEFEFNHEGISSEIAVERLKAYGRNELPEHITPAWVIFLKQFWAPMPVMIWIAIIIEIAIENYVDVAILLAIQISNASISFYETMKAGNAVAALKSSLKPSATCKRDGSFKVIDAALLVPGDTVMLGSGSAVPADCRVNDSDIDVDQAALTGESLPVTFYKGDSVKMGSTVVRGEVEATVEYTGPNTFFGKTAALLKDNHELSHFQKILLRIVFVLVFISVLLCGINLIYYLTRGVELKEALSFTIVLLVASIPLAIEIVTTTTLAIGSKTLAKYGAIVSKLSAIEDMAGMSILCSDKTGTLTLNQMVLQDDMPIYAEGETKLSVLMSAALAAKWKEPPRDALDRLTLGSIDLSLLEPYKQLAFIPFDPTVKRTEGTIRDTRDGKEFKTTKGAPHIILGLLPATENDVKDKVERDVARLGASGVRTLAVAKTNESGAWKMMGLLTFLDPPRPDTKETIRQALEYGVKVKMITGDHLLIARNTAKQLDMGDQIYGPDVLPLLDANTKEKPDDLAKRYGDVCLNADGFAQVFPEHKYLIVECLRELGYSVGMTGDGVNDAPALKRSDVGVAVAGATDAARAAADIILTEEGLGTIIHGIVTAREIFMRMNNFLTYRVSATLQLLFFFFIIAFSWHPTDYTAQPNTVWDEYFHLPVLMLLLITLLNDGTLITIAYDNAEASTHPARWNLPVLFVISSVLGLVSCASSLLLLHILLDSWNPDGIFQALSLNGVPYGQIVTAIYLKVSVSDFLTLFSARAGCKFFWQIPPAPILFAGGSLALLVSSFLAIFWPDGTLDKIDVKGLSSSMDVFVFVWLYCFVFFLIQDGLKVGTYRLLYATNFNGSVKLEHAARVNKEVDEKPVNHNTVLVEMEKSHK